MNIVTQTATAVQVSPVKVDETARWPNRRTQTHDGPKPLYEFEPEAEELIGALLPRYISARIFTALLESAASESAARRRAMKSASDNANDLIKIVHAVGEPGPPGRDHPGNQRDRRRRRRARISRK